MKEWKTAEWRLSESPITMQQTVVLAVDGVVRNDVQYTFGPSDHNDVDGVVEAAMRDIKYFNKDLSRTELTVAKFSLHKLLHKLKDQQT